MTTLLKICPAKMSITRVASREWGLEWAKTSFSRTTVSRRRGKSISYLHLTSRAIICKRMKRRKKTSKKKRRGMKTNMRKNIRIIMKVTSKVSSRVSGKSQICLTHKTTNTQIETAQTTCIRNLVWTLMKTLTK
jgi:hypothetical protein